MCILALFSNSCFDIATVRRDLRCITAAIAQILMKVSRESDPPELLLQNCFVGFILGVSYLLFSSHVCNEWFGCEVIAEDISEV